MLGNQISEVYPESKLRKKIAYLGSDFPKVVALSQAPGQAGRVDVM